MATKTKTTMVEGSSSNNKGVVFQLSPEAASSLRERPCNQTEKENWWDDVIPLGPTQPPKQATAFQNLTGKKASGTVSFDDGKYQAGPYKVADESDGDDVSTGSDNPPPCWPTILIDLQQLVGYVPNTESEAEQVVSQIRRALELSDDFEQSVTELFDTQVARHGTTTPTQEAVNSLEWAPIMYPDQIQDTSLIMDASSPSNNNYVSTKRLWKKVLRSHSIPIVQHLFALLQNCNRCLTWKYAMRIEVEQLVQEQSHQDEWHQWNSHRRKLELQKLYQVRELLQDQIQVTQDRLQELVEVREENVQQELELRRVNGDLMSGFESLESTTMWNDLLPRENGSLDDDDDQYALLSDYGDDRDDTAFGREESSTDDESDSHSDEGSCGEKVQPPPAEISETHPSTASDAEPLAPADQGASDVRRQRGDRRSRRSTRAAQRQEERERRQTAAQEAERARRVEEVKAVRESHTSIELTTTQAMVTSLEQRLTQVDELLETLQDEEWQAEEDGQSNHGDGEAGPSDGARYPSNRGDTAAATSDDDGEAPPSVLEEILAMILVATPPPVDAVTTTSSSSTSSGAEGGGSSSDHGDATKLQQQHREWLRNEHQTIVNGWKQHFGRLPPPLARNPNSSVESLGPGVSSSSFSTSAMDDNVDSRVTIDGASSTPHAETTTLSPERLKETFGIPEVVVDHWEDRVDEGDEENTSEVATAVTVADASDASTPKGLRPVRRRFGR